MTNIYKHILELLQKGESFVLATIISKQGSSPRTAGTKMIVHRDGTITGTIGGGIVEAKVQHLEAKVMETGKPIVEQFNLTGTDVAQMDMICGGRLSVLVEYIDATDKHCQQVFSNFIHCLENREKAVLVTQFYDSTKEAVVNRHCLVKPDGTVIGENTLPLDTVTQLFTSSIERYPQVLEIEGAKYLLEPVYSFSTLFIVGAGHVAQKICPLASMVDFKTVVLDDRADFANQGRFGSADKIVVLESFDNVFNDLAIDSNSFIVIVTRGHAYDKIVLQQALSTTAGYIGMIGSVKKRNAIYQALQKEGFTAKDLSKVHSPIGLKIGADTPEEIAVSIVAELIKVRATGLNEQQ